MKRTYLPSPAGKCLALMSLFCALVAAGDANAQVLTYTSANAFQNNLQPGYYLEDFESYATTSLDSFPSPQNFNRNGFAYSITDGGSQLTLIDASLAGSRVISTFNFDQTLTITFNSANVTAVGGTLLLTGDSGAPVAGAITATLNTGQVVNVTGTNSYASEPFGGFTSSVPITSFTIRGPSTTGLYATLDNLYVGVAVPEPSALLTLGVCGSILVITRRRRAIR